jgi:FkbM family methyltransferase
MRLQELKNEFLTGKTDKWSYIDKMYEHHSLLLEYADFLKQTNISAISIQDDGVVMDFRDSGVRFLTAGQDKRLASLESLNFGHYEKEELDIQLALIDAGSTVFDIGGNYGWYACHVAKQFPTCSIHSFEPIPATHSFLEKNIQLNHLQNVKAVPIGFSDSKGSFDFSYDPALSVNASLKNVSAGANVVSVTCQVETVDEYLKGKDVVIDFIKCDVEGAELLVYKGALETLKSQKPMVFSEMLRKWTSKFDYHPNDIIALFREIGYEIFVIEGDKLAPFSIVDENTTQTNYIFLHKEKHAHKIRQFVQSAD